MGRNFILDMRIKNLLQRNTRHNQPKNRIRSNGILIKEYHHPAKDTVDESPLS